MFSDFQPFSSRLKLCRRTFFPVSRHPSIPVCRRTTTSRAVTAAATTRSVLLITIIIIPRRIRITPAVTITAPRKLVTTTTRRPSSRNRGIVLGGRISCIRATRRLVWARDPVLLWKLWERHRFLNPRKTTRCAAPTRTAVIWTMRQTDVPLVMDTWGGARASRRGWILCCVSIKCHISVKSDLILADVTCCLFCGLGHLNRCKFDYGFPCDYISYRFNV